MKLDQVKYVFFIGIGGIGMSALARYFKHQGCEVAGYDRTETVLTRQLTSEGISVLYTDDVMEIPVHFDSPTSDRLIIYTPAVPSELNLLVHFRQGGYCLLKRSEVLGLISKGAYTIAVAGTHGKTTTSCMIAHVLTDSGYGCSAFLGGISTNYSTNTLFGQNNVLVVEADEYDRSFLTLHPDVAVVTSADADHLDIYGEHQQLTEAFRLFLEQVHTDGTKIIRKWLPFDGDIIYSGDAPPESPADTPDAALHAYAQHVRIEHEAYHFDYVTPDQVIEDIRLGIPGRHNVENAVAAIAAALTLGVEPEKIKRALSGFAGVKRRFEYIVRTPDTVYIDDYAHHPAELRAFLGAVRELYPNKWLTVVFQPHLFSRTRDFMEEFAEALSEADTLLLMDIYPAREQPILGIDSSRLLAQIRGVDTHLVSETDVLEFVRNNKPGLLVTVGAGNIDRLVEPLRNLLTDV